ncbi:MAG: two-component system sensor histidine kinase NtrB [Planctomycetota bacterium]
MKVAEEQADLSASQVRELQEAFAQFCQQTAQLKAAYAELKEKAERVNLELDAANRQLERKVRELDEANNLKRSILESIPTAVVVTDLDGTINTFNPAAEAMWGVSRQDAAGRHFAEVMAPHHGLIGDVLAGRARPETLRRELGGPEPKVIASTACLVEDSSGRPIGALQLDRDLTRLRALESRLHQQEKLADLGKMAAGLAHEIRKPLNGIKGFASILERQAGPHSDRSRYLANITGAADRLSNMLGRLLDFARPDAVRLAPCDLKAEAEQVAEFVRAEDADGPATIVVDVPDEARWALADADKCKQVLLNLVKNGMEALRGEGEVCLSAALEHGGGERLVRVRVADTGSGIPEEVRERILEPFYTEKPGGTGLGLAIVNRILQLHGTQLEVHDRPGGGTSMEFLLPAAADREDG